MAKATCSVHGCEKSVMGRGWCSMHYSRWRKHGTLELPRREKQGCSVNGCDRAVAARGWCATHYARWLHHGDVQADTPIAQRHACSVEGCERMANAHDLCGAHALRLARHSDVQPKTPIRLPYLPLTPDSFWEFVEPLGSCEVWTGDFSSNGYGKVWWDGATESAHRLAFFLRMGRWPESELLRHLCDRRACVLHVVEGTYSENTLDSVAAGTHIHARKTHCKWGHPFDEENTYRPPGGGGRRRQCRACNKRRRCERSRKKR